MVDRGKDSRIDEELTDPARREAHILPESEDQPGPVVVELNLRHEAGATGAERAFFVLYGHLSVGSREEPIVLSKGYIRVLLSVDELRQLLAMEAEEPISRRAIFHVWPDFPLQPLIDVSAVTIKAVPARLAFDATGEGITWAIIDSGIDASHVHFTTYQTLTGPLADWHRDFSGTAWGKELGTALEDPFGHGTHVAGIVAGGLPATDAAMCRVAEHSSLRTQLLRHDGDWIDARQLQEYRTQLDTFSEGEPLIERNVRNSSRLTGMAPLAKLVSLKVLDGAGEGRSSNAIMALRFIREEVNTDGFLRIHGANLSLGYEFNARAFAAGHSPLCMEVDRLVRSGVVVVAAAGNTGFGEVSARTGLANAPLLSTINDPGNAALAITVGSAHRTNPHDYGVSYFSSKGPTGDGRLKPDLVAPGERITSCAAGRYRAQVLRSLGEQEAVAGVAYYIDLDGTSMAAPHVSGAAAAFLSAQPEFLGHPEQVKRVLVSSATSLGRERTFEGHGLVDLLRALQSV
jgi:subtilisin family serine protease